MWKCPGPVRPMGLGPGVVRPHTFSEDGGRCWVFLREEAGARALSAESGLGLCLEGQR